MSTSPFVGRVSFWQDVQLSSIIQFVLSVGFYFGFADEFLLYAFSMLFAALSMLPDGGVTRELQTAQFR